MAPHDTAAATAIPEPTADAVSPAEDADRIVTLNFDWRAHHFTARLNRQSVDSSRLQVTCDLGPVPFSAEGVERRRNIFAVLEATQANRLVRTSVSPRQRISMTAETRLDAPVTTRSFVAGIVTLLSQARPYLDLIRLLQQPAGSVRLRQ